MVETDLIQGESPGGYPIPYSTRHLMSKKLSRSNSIKNLISFYETTYSKKDTTRTTLLKNSQLKTYETQSIRQITSPMTHPQSLSFESPNQCGYLNLPASPISQPGFSPSSSSSSSSSSSTERLSFYNSYTPDSSHKKDQNETSKETPSLLWSLSTASSSSGFSSGFSSPLQSDAPIFTTTTDDHELIKITTEPQTPDSNSPASPHTSTIATVLTKTKNNSFSDISSLAKQKLWNLKLVKNTSLSKLLDKTSKSSASRQLKTTQSFEQSTVPSQIERPTDLTLFKSIKKVLHTVKLCKLEKFTPEIKSNLDEVKDLTSDKLSARKNPPETVSLNEISVETCELQVTANDVDIQKKIEPSLVKAVEEPVSKPPKPVKSISMIENGEMKSVNLIQRKSTFANRSFDKKIPCNVTNEAASTTKPSWSSTMSTSYSFSHSSKPVTRSQSQKYVQNNTSQRRFDPRNAQKIVLDWCQLHTRNYENVRITNFSSSWSDGLAFCALIHNFLPDSFDYEKLKPQNRRQNFDLAFETAHRKAGIMPLLEVNDMLNMGNRPDDRCVFTYVSTIFSRFQQKPKQMVHKSVSAPGTATNNPTRTTLNNSLSLRN